MAEHALTLKNLKLVTPKYNFFFLFCQNPNINFSSEIRGRMTVLEHTFLYVAVAETFLSSPVAV